MQIVISVLIAILKAFLPAIKAAARDTAEDTKVDKDLKARWRRRILAPGLLCFVLLLPGCGVKAIYVPDGVPVRLRADVPGVPIWVKDKNGIEQPSTMTLKNGWYAGSLPKE